MAAAACLAVTPGLAMDRYMDVQSRIAGGPKMDLVSATFFGAGGVEEFVGAAVASDGRIAAIGNSWGPPFPDSAATRVLGGDLPWNLPLASVEEVLKRGRPAHMPSVDHPNRTGFLAFYSSDLTRLEEVVRLGWGSASILAMRPMRDGSFVIAGRAHRPLDALPCPPHARRRQRLPSESAFVPLAFGGVTQSGDVYLAKLTPELTGFAWILTLEGFGEAPQRLYEGAGGEVIFKARRNLWRLSGDGATLRDYSGTPLAEMATRIRGVSPTDGRVIVGGTWLIGTGREPWKQPWMDVFDSGGNHIESYYWWSGPMVGHDDFRLVSDSTLERIEPLANGDYLLTGGSDGGNSVFCRHPSDLESVPRGTGLPMSTWGAGVGHWSHFVRFNPRDITDVSYTLWSAFTSGGPASIYVHDIRGMNDGSLAILGYASPFLVQTTNRWYRATTHFLRQGKPARQIFHPNGWPVYQGHGGHGGYVAVLNPEFDNLLWSSVIANCEHTDAVASKDGLIVTARAITDVKQDGRTPAFVSYDVADWPGLIAKLATSGSGASASVRRIRDRLDTSLREALTSHRQGREPADELRERVLDAFDEILFDDRTFHDAAVWPDADLDAYERDLVKKLRAGTIGEEELGHLNRGLFERALPDHVFARPRHNRTPAVRAVQGGFGGGSSDGYIYLLKSPPGRRLDVARAPRAASAEPVVAAPAVPTLAETGEQIRKGSGTRSFGGAFEFAFAPARRRELRLPGFCASYAVIRNAAKLKPLFLHGWGEAGAVTVRYGNQGGLADEVEFVASGSGTLLLKGLNTKPAPDWERFACGEWLSTKPGEIPLRVVFKALRGWKEETDTFRRLVDAERGLLPPETLALLAARFRVDADLDISVGAHTQELKAVPFRAVLKDLGGAGTWVLRLEATVSLDAGALGLTREGDGALTLKLVHEGFAPSPSALGPPTMDDAMRMKDTGGNLDLME